MSTWLQALDAELEDKRARGLMRQFTPIQQDGVWVQALEAGSDTLPGSGAMFELASSARQDSTSNAVITSASKKGRWMLNLSGNDYLGLAADASLREAFFQSELAQSQMLGSASSRLLTGSFPIYHELENLMLSRFKSEAVLLFNSGYHANIGILPALANKRTLLILDKLVHASLIDGARLSGANYLRYRHNDYEHLESLLQQHHESCERIIVVTESVFSMDGDCADLKRLVALKKRYDKLALYVDEAHAVGAYGATGLGLAEQEGCLGEIDFLVGTFGKALGSVGAYLVCTQLIKDYLINTMRPLIFSTALPPINIAWTYFLFERLEQWHAKRQHLVHLSRHLKQAVETITGQTSSSQTCIIPLLLGENHRAVTMAKTLQEAGFYCLPIRPPTVPSGTARIRFSLSAAMQTTDIDSLIKVLESTCKVDC